MKYFKLFEEWDDRKLSDAEITKRNANRVRSETIPFELKINGRQEIIDAWMKTYWLKKYVENPLFKKVIYLAPNDLTKMSLAELENLVKYILKLKQDLIKFGFSDGFTFLNRYLNEALLSIAYQTISLDPNAKTANPAIKNGSIVHLKDDFFLADKEMKK